MEKGTHSLAQKIENFLTPAVEHIGYTLLDVEYQSSSPNGGPVVRLFIDHQQDTGSHIGLADCEAVDRNLDPILESAEFEALLPTAFHLEVSSPGLDRPLKKRGDYERFQGSRATLKTFRPPTATEINNESYFQDHAKQKNFTGVLKGIEENSVLLEVDNELVHIPLAIICKANLDVASQVSMNNKDDE